MSKNKITIEKLFELLGIINEVSLKEVSKDIGIPISELKYYNDNMLIPIGRDMEKIVAYTGMCKEEIELRLGVISSDVYNWINKNAASIIKKINFTNITRGFVTPVFRTQYGTLYNADCINVLRGMPDESVDMVFADPPFNLNKEYGDNINDSLARSEYISWCEVWIKECIRVLKPGGAIFIYNLPYWNTFISNILNRYLNFRHWIAVSMKGLLPVQGKLQPEHYALLYYIKGERPKTFNKQRIPLVTCRHCGGFHGKHFLTTMRRKWRSKCRRMSIQSAWGGLLVTCGLLRPLKSKKIMH